MKKNGFTMVELLLCIAIIGVVSAMGMTITKHSTDRAYNLFFYNGYINLYNSIADILAEGGEISATSLNARLGTSKELPADRIIQTINGVTYQYNNNVITMTVPQKKTRNNNSRATVLFRYVNEGDGYLVPLINGSNVDLQNRRDLLPAYVDNGIVGRVKRQDEAGNNYRMEQQIAFYSYRQAYCSIQGNNSIDIGTEEAPDIILDCTNHGGLSDQVGVLKVANPSKAR